MKKWLDEASALCGHYSVSASDNGHDSSNKGSPQSCHTTTVESFGNDSRLLNSADMGLGVSSGPFPKTNSEVRHTDENNSNNCTECATEFPIRRPLTFMGSMSRQIPVNSPCHQHPISTCSAPTQSSLSSVDPLKLASESNIPNLHMPLCTQSTNEAGSIDSHLLIIQSAVTPPARNNVSQFLEDIVSTDAPCQGLGHCQAEALPLSIIKREVEIQTTSTSIEFSNQSESHSENVTDACNQVIYGRHRTHTDIDYDTTLMPSTANCLNSAADHYGSTMVPSSNGCGHWCSACKVKVQVELECVPAVQRSPGPSRRGIRTLSFPKRVRHKVKAPTKDLNGNHKKKKSPWSFRLNCHLRSNKSEVEQESSSLNIGCASCVCPRYHRTDIEPVYRSGSEEGSSTNSMNVPIVDRSYPINDFEETSRQERVREIAEGFDPLPQNSLSLPLTYNSMLDLQVLRLESSLRIGLGNSRSDGNGTGISYSGEPFVSTYSSENAGLSHTVHTQVDYIHCLVPDLLAITNCGFYWGKMDRYEAERLLENRPEGTFLLRDSAQEEYLFSVSFRRYGRSLHARIEQLNHKFSFDSHDPGVFASEIVCGLIEHYKDPSCCMFFEPLLTNPLSRTFPFPLQHLCRAVICSHTNYDGINRLELPKSLKNYLKEYHYKQRLRVRHLD